MVTLYELWKTSTYQRCKFVFYDFEKDLIVFRINWGVLKGARLWVDIENKKIRGSNIADFTEPYDLWIPHLEKALLASEAFSM